MKNYALGIILVASIIFTPNATPISLHRRAADPRCQTLSKSDLASIPGWQKLQDLVLKNNGKWDNVQFD